MSSYEDDAIKQVWLILHRKYPEMAYEMTYDQMMADLIEIHNVLDKYYKFQEARGIVTKGVGYPKPKPREYTPEQQKRRDMLKKALEEHYTRRFRK